MQELDEARRRYARLLERLTSEGPLDQQIKANLREAIKALDAKIKASGT
ncbi:MAG: hypothetical protein AAF409_01090 [Pseudomonadota bacterium]